MSDGAARENFGFTATGEKVERVTISKGGLTAKVITWGAVIQDLRLEGHQPPLVLGFDKFEDYKYSSYFGATPGRNANRIGNGRFSIDGHEYQLELNEKGVTHLHGGSDGMGKRNWMLMEHGESHAVLQIIDPDGRAGYPGNCTVTATYTIRDGGVLSVVYETVTDKPTIANVCQVLYDHNFCLSPERRAKRRVARAYSPASDIALEVHTTEPGVQFYSAFKLDVPVPGLDGRHYGPFAGFCLETQIWPDAVNHPDFPHAILRPGETLRQKTDYIFKKG